jgi:hypothetical protein
MPRQPDARYLCTPGLFNDALRGTGYVGLPSISEYRVQSDVQGSGCGWVEGSDEKTYGFVGFQAKI